MFVDAAAGDCHLQAGSPRSVRLRIHPSTDLDGGVFRRLVFARPAFGSSFLIYRRLRLSYYRKKAKDTLLEDAATRPVNGGKLSRLEDRLITGIDYWI